MCQAVVFLLVGVSSYKQTTHLKYHAIYTLYVIYTFFSYASFMFICSYAVSMFILLMFVFHLLSLWNLNKIYLLFPT